MLSQDGNGIAILSSGPIDIRNWVDAIGDILISSRDDVIVKDHMVSTWDDDAVGSGNITIESWAGASGLIDARNATIRSGYGDPQSGDVSLLIRSESGGPGPEPVESFFLPKRVVVKVNERKPEKSKVIAAGYFDMGPDAMDLTESATLTIGNEVVSVPGLVPNAGATKYVHKVPGLLFQIVPNRRGSSRAKFKLKMTGDLTGKVDPDEDLDLRFECDEVDSRGCCALTSGKYALKKVRGTLLHPNLYLSRVKAKIAGGGKDKLKLVLGLATDGSTPAAAEDVRIRFGDDLDVTIPAGSLTREGDRFVFKGDAEGITQVVVDYARESVTVKGKGMDLGDFPQGACSVLVGIEIGGEGRAVRVRMVRTNAALRY